MAKKLATTNANAVVINTAESLRDKLENYKGDFVTRANKVLYGLLADMQHVYENIVAMDVVEKEHTLNMMRVNLKEKHGIKTQNNTTDLALLLRYITLGSSRKTVCVYSRVIKSAIEAGIGHADLPSYIEKWGGIDKVRSQVAIAAAEETKKSNEAFNNRKIAYALSCLAQTNPLVVKKNPANKSFVCKNGKDVDYTVAICRRSKDGELEVMATVATDKRMEDIVLQRYAELMYLGQRETVGHEFMELCKQIGVGADVVHYWLRDNGLKGYAEKTWQEELEDRLFTFY